MKFKFLYLFLLIVFIHNQAVATEVMTEKIGSWIIETKVDEFTDEVISTHIMTTDMLGTEIRLPYGCVKYTLELAGEAFNFVSSPYTLNIKDNHSITVRVRIDKNKMVVLKGVGGLMRAIKKAFIFIEFPQEIIKQMLTGKNILVDVTGDKSRVLGDKIIKKFDLNGFSEVYSRVCPK